MRQKRRTRPDTDKQGQRRVKAPKRTRAAARPRRRPAGGPGADRQRRGRVGAAGGPRPAQRRHTKTVETPERARPPPAARTHLGPLKPRSGGSWRAAPQPAPARPRCRWARAGPRAVDAEPRLGARADTRKTAHRRPRRPAAREGRGEPGGGGEPPNRREATEGDGPEAEVAARPARSPLCGGKPAQPPAPSPHLAARRHFRRADLVVRRHSPGCRRSLQTPGTHRKGRGAARGRRARSTEPGSRAVPRPPPHASAGPSGRPELRAHEPRRLPPPPPATSGGLGTLLSRATPYTVLLDQQATQAGCATCSVPRAPGRRGRGDAEDCRASGTDASA